MTIVSGRFEDDAIGSARVFGMPELQFVVVPWIYRNLDLQRVKEQTNNAIDGLIQELTTVRPAAKQPIDSLDTELFAGADRFEAAEAMNREFLQRDLGDGFPLRPPTVDAVERLLTGTCLRPDHVLCDLPPGFGLATVEKVAINAAMAGAEPEHMPVILAALKALSNVDPKAARNFLLSTSSHASLLLVNGPIRMELGINAQAAMGPGRQNRVNLTIGRAYTLCLKNIGHWYPGSMDMDTIGSTRKFTACVGENEEASPWEPFHQEKGYPRNDSVVTVFGTKGEVDVADQGNTTAEGLLRMLGYNSIFGQWRSDSIWETIIFMPPDVVRPVAEGGFTKQMAKRFIHEHACFSQARMAAYRPSWRNRLTPEWSYLLDLTDEQLDKLWVPVRESADRYQLICVGADRAKPMVMPSMPIRPSSEGVDQYRPKS